MYTDEQKQAIFSQWCEYQRRHNVPEDVIGMYSYKAYTNDMFVLWENVMAIEKVR